MSEYVDISSHNGTPDLRAHWNAGYRYLMLKATEGTGYSWPLMQALARQWHSFGPDARVGYYHWLYGTLSARAQYEYFWAQVGPVFRAGDWMMTDFEDVDPSRWVSDAAHRASVETFDSLCAQHGPVHDYAPDWYIANLPQCVEYFRTRGLNVASDYSHTPPGNRFGRTFVAHQFTDRATVPGIAGPVDCNRWLIASGPAVTGTSDNTGGFPMALSDADQDALFHEVGVTDANVKLMGTWVQSVLLRLAALQAALTGESGTLAALKVAVDALVAAPPGTVDISDVLEKLNALPGQVRAELKSDPLSLTGGVIS